MNSFLPYQSFKKSAQCLDTARLGKQRSEVIIMLQAICDGQKAWKNHPCTLMWFDYHIALAVYGLEICSEYKQRGYQDGSYIKIEAYIDQEIVPEQDWLRINRPDLLPMWLGNEKLHSSHRSNLKRKDPYHYKQFTEPDNLEYFWPGRYYVGG